MRLLLDTHVLIWLHNEPNKLSRQAETALGDSKNEVLVGAATAWEIAIKARSGRLVFDKTFIDDFDDRLRAIGFEPLVITASHAVAAARLPGRHKDPFDRMIAGQAAVEAATVITADPLIAQFGVPVLW